MIRISNRIEEPLLDALFTFSEKPTIDDAIHCILDPSVQDASVQVAEQMRRLAIAADAVTIEENKHRTRKLSLINWREFYVGSVGIGLVPAKHSSSQYEWFAFAAFNTKPHRNQDKFCSEMRIMRAGRDVRCVCFGGFVVIGERQFDGRSNIARWTLDPCEACRDKMRLAKNRRMFRKDTLILTAQPGSQLRIIKKIPQLMRDHGESW